MNKSRGAILERFPRAKTKLALRWQDPILQTLARFPVSSLRSRILRKGLQRVVGGVLWSIKLEVNNFCELSCRMCYSGKGNDELPMKTIQRLLDDISATGTRLEILGGEPLLREDLAEIIAYAKRQAHIPQVLIYTNAIAANDKTVLRLSRAGLDTAIVNLTSASEIDHDVFVGMRGAWRKTVDGIRRFQKAGVSVYTFTAIHSENIDSAKDTYYFVRQELGAHALFYQYIPQIKDDPLIPNKRQWSQIKRWILCVKNPEHSRFVRNFCTLSGSACSGGDFVLTVKVDGTVTPCPFISDISLGNINNQSIWRIMRQRFQVPQFLQFESLPADCQGCAYADICNGGCKAGNNVLFGHYGHKDHRCIGPWDESLNEQAICDRLPCFF